MAGKQRRQEPVCARCGGRLDTGARYTYAGGRVCRCCWGDMSAEERGFGPMRKLYPTKRAYEAAVAASEGRKGQ